MDFFFILSGFESILEGLFGPALLKDLSLYKGIQNLFFSFSFLFGIFQILPGDISDTFVI